MRKCAFGPFWIGVLDGWLRRGGLVEACKVWIVVLCSMVKGGDVKKKVFFLTFW